MNTPKRGRRAWLVLALLAGLVLYVAAWHWAGGRGVIAVAVVGGVLAIVREVARTRGGRR